MEKKAWKILAIIFIGLFILSLVGSILVLYHSSFSEKEATLKEEFFNNFYKGIKEYLLGSFNQDNGEYNYDLFSLFYKDGYLEEAINSCSLARDTYMASNEHYHKAINYFKKANETAQEEYEEKIKLYIKASDIAINMNYAIYEACEYLETASDYYLNNNFENGDKAIEKANEKIKLRDSYVKEYNDYLSKLEILEENIL